MPGLDDDYLILSESLRPKARVENRPRPQRRRRLHSIGHVHRTAEEIEEERRCSSRDDAGQGPSASDGPASFFVQPAASVRRTTTSCGAKPFSSRCDHAAVRGVRGRSLLQQIAKRIGVRPRRRRGSTLRNGFAHYGDDVGADGGKNEAAKGWCPTRAQGRHTTRIP